MSKQSLLMIAVALLVLAAGIAFALSRVADSKDSENSTIEEDARTTEEQEVEIEIYFGIESQAHNDPRNVGPFVRVADLPVGMNP